MPRPGRWGKGAEEMEQPRIRAQSAGENEQGTIHQYLPHGNEPGRGWPGVTGQGGVFQCFPEQGFDQLSRRGFDGGSPHRHQGQAQMPTPKPGPDRWGAAASSMAAQAGLWGHKAGEMEVGIMEKCMALCHVSHLRRVDDHAGADKVEAKIGTQSPSSTQQPQRTPQNWGTC